MPVAEWFRGELKDFAYSAMFETQDEVLNRTFLTQCWNQHQRGQRDWSALGQERLLVTPLVHALQQIVGQHGFLAFLDSFRYRPDYLITLLT